MFPYKKAMYGRESSEGGGGVVLGVSMLHQNVCGTKLSKEKERKISDTEESDLPERSVKKSKENARDDCTMDDIMVENNIPVEEVSSPSANSDVKMNLPHGRKEVSYKDKVLSVNGQEFESDSEEDDWMRRQRREEEEDGNEIPEEDDDPLCPTYRFSKSQHKKECEQWRKALILKLLGKRVSSGFLMARLKKMWSLVGSFEKFDLDNGHVLIKFADSKDYHHVLHEGPWVVLSLPGGPEVAPIIQSKQ